MEQNNTPMIDEIKKALDTLELTSSDVRSKTGTPVDSKMTVNVSLMQSEGLHEAMVILQRIDSHGDGIFSGEAVESEIWTINNYL